MSTEFGLKRVACALSRAVSAPICILTCPSRVLTWQLPCTLAGNGLSFSTFVNTVPINGNRTINRFALIRNLSGPLVQRAFNMDAWDKLAVDAMIKCAPPPWEPGLNFFAVLRLGGCMCLSMISWVLEYGHKEV